MHATTEQLLDIRDGTPVDSAVLGHVELCGSCSRELRQFRLNQQALLELPVLAPSPQVFSQLEQRIEDEKRARLSNRRIQPVQLAVAATVVAALALWMVPRDMDSERIEGELNRVAQQNVPSTTQSAPVLVNDEVAQREELLQRSASLEAVAEQLALMGTVAPSNATDEALSALEARLALVDYNLSAAQIDQYAPTELNELLARRVSTLENIVGVQRAELARQGYHGFQVMTASNVEEDQTW